MVLLFLSKEKKKREKCKGNHSTGKEFQGLAEQRKKLLNSDRKILNLTNETKMNTFHIIHKTSTFLVRCNNTTPRILLLKA